MITKKRTIGLVLICLLTVGIASVYAKGGNPFGEGGLLALITRVEELEARIAELEAAPPGLGTPDFDSEWTEITCSENIDFDLGFDVTDNLFVYILGRFKENDEWVYHQFHFGGDSEWKSSLGYSYNYGLDWAMGSKFSGGLCVHRMPNDRFWQEVRVMAWQLPPTP